MTAYEPGTVAVATVRGVPNKRIVRCTSENLPPCWFAPTYLPSETGNGWWPEDYEVTDIRPLVVLDLDLAAHIGVDRLVSDLRASGFYDLADQIEAQTRPPKPDEPTGLGAVVEDAKGLTWVRRHPAGPAWVNAYQRFACWDEFDAVRVLSSGVEA